MLFVYSYIRVASDMNKNDDKASNVSEYRCHKAYAMNLEKKQGYNSITCEPQPLANQNFGRTIYLPVTRVVRYTLSCQRMFAYSDAL